MVPDQSHAIVIEYLKLKFNVPAKVGFNINDVWTNHVVDEHVSGFTLNRR